MLYERLWHDPRFGKATFLVLFLLGVVDRAYLLLHFGFKYASTDDGILWTAATDYAHGIFHSFYFYGQDYNPMFEALLGAPLIALGVSPEFALPAVTSLLALLPFWSFGWWNLRRGRPLAAAIFLSVPLLLPVEYGMITAMPRGFVQGIALFAALPWLGSIRNAGMREILYGAVLSTALVFNPNSSVAGIAFAVLLLWAGRRKFITELRMLLGSLPALMGWIIGEHIARAHPEHVLHTIHGWRMVFHAELIPEALGQLHLHFQWLFPLVWPLGQLAFWCLPLLVVLTCFQRRWSLALALCAALGMILYSFAFAKVHDGFQHVLYPYARMFLAVPLVLAWGTTEWLLSRRVRPGLPLMVVMVLSLVMVPIKIVMTPDIVAKQMQDQGPLPVKSVEVERLRDHLAFMELEAGRHDVDAIIALGGGADALTLFRAYNEPVWSGHLPPVTILEQDRRYWVREEVEGSVYATLMFIGGPEMVWERARAKDPSILLIAHPDGPVHIVPTHGIRTDLLLKDLLKDGVDRVIG